MSNQKAMHAVVQMQLCIQVPRTADGPLDWRYLTVAEARAANLPDKPFPVMALVTGTAEGEQWAFNTRAVPLPLRAFGDGKGALRIEQLAEKSDAAVESEYLERVAAREAARALTERAMNAEPTGFTSELRTTASTPRPEPVRYEYKVQDRQVFLDAVNADSSAAYEATYVNATALVDGKQRLEATRKFMRDELRAFGQLRSEFAGRMRWHVTGLKWRVCALDRAGVLRFYLSLNGGGTPHTTEELERVRALLAQAEHG